MAHEEPQVTDPSTKRRTVKGVSDTAERPDSTPLLQPRDGVPPVVDTETALTETIRSLAGGTGPLAVDAERASGYRYGQRAYLVQVRRAGAGTALIDPVACPDLTGLDTAATDAENVLHAAGQDLPCLAELGFKPRTLFDTELAGRLLGYQRVGLQTMVDILLGLALEKGHSAVDWSSRPLPVEWLRYAALDVEVLVELRDILERELHLASKLEWAREEFAAIAAAPPPKPRSDPWRRTSGIHRVRTRRGLAAVRELWRARDRVARERDLSPGRVLGDSAIVESATAMPRSPAELAKLAGFAGRGARRYVSTWFGALAHARKLPEDELPEPSAPADGPPPANRWAERDPVAAQRLSATRAAVTALAERHTMPAENILAPDTVRRLAWTPPKELSVQAISAELAGYGARSWQVELTAAVLASALQQARKESGS